MVLGLRWRRASARESKESSPSVNVIRPALILLSFILIPFALWGDMIDAWTTAQLTAPTTVRATVGLLVVGVLAADILLPVPSSITSTLAGSLLGLPLGAAASFIGMTMGCIVGYRLGRTGGRAVAARMMGAREMERLESVTERHGDWTVALSRAVPVLAEASVLVAGVARMSFPRFLIIASLSNLGISVAYASIGRIAADSNSFLLAFFGAMGLPLLAWLGARAAGLTNRKVNDPAAGDSTPRPG